jgi:hypothetical protein
MRDPIALSLSIDFLLDSPIFLIAADALLEPDMASFGSTFTPSVAVLAIIHFPLVQNTPPIK